MQIPGAQLNRAESDFTRTGGGHAFREHCCNRCRDVPPRSPFKEILAAQMHKIYVSANGSWELPCLTSCLSWDSPLVTEWGKEIKTWPFWPMYVTLKGTAHSQILCWAGQGFLGLPCSLTSSSALSYFTISFICFDPLWTSCIPYSAWYLLL